MKITLSWKLNGGMVDFCDAPPHWDFRVQGYETCSSDVAVEHPKYISSNI